MTRWNKLLERILRGTSDANISFNELCELLRRLGFDERVRGDHHIFSMVGIAEILNLQPKKAKAKSYQVKQVRDVIVKHKLGDDNDPI